MSLYARHSPRFARQLAADLFVVAWTVLWIVVGTTVHDAVAKLATPALRTAEAARRVQTELTQAAGQAGEVPALGTQLRRPFDGAANSLDAVITAAAGQAAAIDRLAVLVGVVVVVLPVLLVLLVWLPLRVRFIRTSSAAARYLDAEADLDLFALRAMATQPLPVLAGISGDPVRAWRAGDREVIIALAAVELRRCGLDVPPELRSDARPAGAPAEGTAELVEPPR